MSTQTPRPPQRPNQHRNSGGGRYPQSSIVRSLFDRKLMNLADRGGASGYVGTAWGAQCNLWLDEHEGAPIMWGEDNVGTIEKIIDVDALPGVASFASARSLQNPDYLLVISTDEGVALVGADAKFSVETAKPKQVSIEIVSALVETPGSPLTALVPAYDLEIDGFFLSPDFELTDLVLSGRGGIQRVSIEPSDVVRIRPDVGQMFERSDIRAAMDVLARIDLVEEPWESSLTSALYYARVAFACLGCHLDERKPLLGPWDQSGERDSGLADAVSSRTKSVRSAWDLLLKWDRDAEHIREVRLRVHGAADIGLMNRDLRHMIEADAKQLAITPPSLNRVRRTLQSGRSGNWIAQLAPSCGLCQTWRDCWSGSRPRSRSFGPRREQGSAR